jgi:hypothetical protein
LARRPAPVGEPAPATRLLNRREPLRRQLSALPLLMGQFNCRRSRPMPRPLWTHARRELRQLAGRTMCATWRSIPGICCYLPAGDCPATAHSSRSTASRTLVTRPTYRSTRETSPNRSDDSEKRHAVCVLASGYRIKLATAPFVAVSCPGWPGRLQEASPPKARGSWRLPQRRQRCLPSWRRS